MPAFHVVGLPAVGPDAAPALRRWLVIAPADALGTLWPALASHLAPVGSAAWRWTDVRSGVARILPATAEQFVPQMINFEAIGGVSFDKGCYPGQEIVARSHYLGKVKRRVFLAHADGPEPPPGAEVTDDAGQPVGVVALAAPAPGGGIDLLAEIQTAAASPAATLRVDARPLRLDALPYPLASGD